MYKNIYSSSCGDKELEIEGMPINWGMTEQVVVYECNGILLCYKNDEQEDFREAWKDFYDLMLNERSRNRRTLCTATTTMCKSFF